VSVLADDEVIVDRNAERPGHRDDRLQGALNHFARIDRGMIDGAGLLHFIGDEQIALIKEQQHSKLLAIGEALRSAAIVEHARPM